MVLIFLIRFFIRWVIPIAFIILLESYTSGWTQILLFICGMAIFLTYMWFTTHPVGSGDDDPSGNDNVNRKFIDYM